MKHLLATLCLTAFASAHYIFPVLNTGKTQTKPWTHVRTTTHAHTNTYVLDVASVQIRCDQEGSNGAPNVLTVNAGDTLSTSTSLDLEGVGVFATQIIHPGPALVYMAKVPDGSTAMNWDGSGQVWFKIYEDGGVQGGKWVWPAYYAGNITATIPKAVPSGDYLVRFEHIGLQFASTAGQAQHYLSCAQVTVKNGGNGVPEPLVAFPGAYLLGEPALTLDVNGATPASYTPPGPRPWKG